VPEQRPIDRALFREGEDGSTVFFPWGLGHRGYRLPDDAARQRASRAASWLLASVLAIATWTAHALQPLLGGEGGFGAALEALAAPAAALVLVLVAYAVWVSRFVERCHESDLRMSPEERLREAAEIAEPGKLAVAGAATCGLSGLLVWLEPGAWWLGALGVAVGVGLVWWSMLLRRAAAESGRPVR